MDPLPHLQDSLWTPELEHALERFSISTYLNWLDQHHIVDDDSTLNDEFPERFLTYLKSKVRNPCSQTKCLLHLLMLIRENMAFITITAGVTWNICLPSAVPLVERNSAS